LGVVKKKGVRRGEERGRQGKELGGKETNKSESHATSGVLSNAVRDPPLRRRNVGKTVD